MFKLITEPNPILHTKTKPVDKIDQSIHEIVLGMRQIMKQANGIGLAAPQVGISQQIAIVEIPLDREDNKSKKNEKPLQLTLINPKITQSSREFKANLEGCLSIPGIEVNVTRPVSVTINYLDLDSMRQTLTASNLLARVIQHEIDHLNGILITDHGKAQPIKDESN